MSLKTPESQAFATLISKEIDPTTRKSVEIYLTEEEYQGTLALLCSKEPPMQVAVLDDGSAVALSDIRRLEVIKRPIAEDHQLEKESEPNLTEEEILKGLKRMAEMREILKVKLKMPDSGKRLPDDEFLRRKERLIKQGEQLKKEMGADE